MALHSDSWWLSILPPFVSKRIVGHHNLQKILNNTGWLFFDKILRMCTGLFVGVECSYYYSTHSTIHQCSMHFPCMPPKKKRMNV